MDVVGRYIGETVLIIVLLAIAMFFSCSEATITSVSHGRVKKLSDEGRPNADKLLKLKERQSDFAAHVSMCANLCVFISAAVASYMFASPMYDLLCKIIALCTNRRVDMLPQSDARVTAAVSITIVLTAFIAIVLGITLPKKLAAKDREGLALASLKLLPFLAAVFKPITFLPIKLANGISLLLGVNPRVDLQATTEDEIRMLVEAGNQSGSIELSECEMINNIFEFDDRTVGEVMTHRTDLCAINITEPLQEVVSAAINEGFSRIPIYDNEIDNIVGTIYVKDLLVFTLGERDIEQGKIRDYLRDVIYAPESAKCRTLFKQFKESKTHMAVVVDEYGGTAGIVTMEDLLESIVGNIQDEYDEEQDEFEIVDVNTFILDGGIEVERLCKLLQVELPFEQHAETLGGLITNELGFIPEDTGSLPVVVLEGIEFTILEVGDRRIQRVKAVVLMQTNEDAAETA